MEERFEYDDMNRLTDISLKRTSGQDLYCSATYDALGRMTSKQAVVSVNGTPQTTSLFSLPSFDATKVHALASAQTAMGLFAETQTVAYTGFDKVSKIKQDKDSLCYTYGYDHQRISMEEHVGNTTRTKRYVGNCEHITETTGGNTETQWLTYLTGPYGVFAVVMSKSGLEDTFYVLKDNFGSWTTITDADGAVEQQLSFDAWGNLRNPNTWTNYTASDSFEKPMFDRGYTGHEHLTAFGLINMNGRMYDPVMSSFLSADRYVQDPSSAQGFNRYAYCLYNPLRYVDPTGWRSGSGGGHGYGDHPPGELYYVNGMPTVNLPEVTIIADNPSLSNTYEYEEYEYTPNITSGGFDNGWGWTHNGTTNGRSGGGGGSGSQGGGSQNIDLAVGTLTAMWGVSVAEPTPAGEVISGIVTIAATVYYGEELMAKMEKEIAHLLTRPDGPEGFVYELRTNTSGYYPCVKTSTLEYMEAGEVWKIGETTQGDNRYTGSWMNSVGEGGVSMHRIYYGNQREIKLYEKKMLFDYYIKNGHLPPGNKIFR